jgi:hypothetical protein
MDQFSAAVIIATCRARLPPSAHPANIMRLANRMLLLPALAAGLAAQSTGSVNDVGLTIDGGTTGNGSFGQACGPFSCTPATASAVLAGSTRQVTHWGAESTPFVVAISLLPAAPMCLPFPGIGNVLELDLLPVTLAVGVTATVDASTFACPVTPGRTVLAMPPTAPPGIAFRLQSIGISFSTQGLAFSRAIDSVTQ